MNGNKVKNIVIISLILLNIALLSLNLTQRESYQVTNRQTEAVIALLNKNEITIASGVTLMRDYTPRQQIQLTPLYKNNIEMSRIFFGDIGIARQRVEFGKTILSQDTKVLTIGESSFFFENPSGNEKINLTKEEAERLCNEMLQNFSHKDLDMQLDYSYERDDYFILEYRAVFRKQIIHSSYARFKVNKNGIVEFRGSFYVPESYTGNAQNIYSCDEALMAFLNEWQNIYGNEPATVRKVDMVYRSDDSGGDSLVKASPYYRIYVITKEGQYRHEPFLVNAYLNVVYK